jgi:hypothetical protein
MPGVARRGDVALAQAPAEIPAARAARGDEGQFLARALPHVGDPRVAGGAVEAVAQGVAQAVGVDLAACTGGADAGVVGRHRAVDVGVGDVVAIDVHAQHLAQQRVQPLAVVERIVAAAAVAGGDGQVLAAAGLEADPARLVAGQPGRLLDAHHLDGARRVGGEGVAVPAVAGDHRLLRRRVDVVDEEAAVTWCTDLRVAGVEGQAEQPAFAAGGHRDLQEVAGHAAGHGLDRAALLHHVQSRPPATGEVANSGCASPLATSTVSSARAGSGRACWPASASRPAAAPGCKSLVGIVVLPGRQAPWSEASYHAAAGCPSRRPPARAPRCNRMQRRRAARPGGDQIAMRWRTPSAAMSAPRPRCTTAPRSITRYWSASPAAKS